MLSTLYRNEKPDFDRVDAIEVRAQHGIRHFFRTKLLLGFRRGTPSSPLKPRLPVSQDSLMTLLAWEDLGGRIDQLSCRTRTRTLPCLMSLGGFGSRSGNLRF